ncbi:SecDF P1 head subdomain-containing protein, partial [Streptomyces afghaniensis]
MNRSVRVRALLALAVIALSLYIAVTVPVRLGLDLRGGTQLVLQTRSTPTTDAGPEATDRTLEVLRGRIDGLGVAEPTLVRSGENRIIVELPGVQDPKRAADVLGRTAQLTFHPVLGTADRTDEASRPLPKRPREHVLPDEAGTPLRLGAAALTGEDVKEAAARFDQQGGAGWHVTVDFEGDGRAGWARLTGEAACHPAGDPARRVAIVLD